MKISFVVTCTYNMIIHPVQPFSSVHVLAFSIFKIQSIITSLSKWFSRETHRNHHPHRQHQLQLPQARFCCRHPYPVGFLSKFHITNSPIINYTQCTLKLRSVKLRFSFWRALKLPYRSGIMPQFSCTLSVIMKVSNHDLHLISRQCFDDIGCREMTVWFLKSTLSKSGPHPKQTKMNLSQNENLNRVPIIQNSKKKTPKIMTRQQTMLDNFWPLEPILFFFRLAYSIKYFVRSFISSMELDFRDYH